MLYSQFFLQRNLEIVMSIKLMIFDVIGTTVYDDNAVANTFFSAFKKNGYKIDIKDINNFMGLSKPEAIKEILNKYSETTPDHYEVNKIYKDFKNDVVDHYKNDFNIKPVSYAESVFYKLKERNVIICLDTGFDREILEIILNRLNWNNLVDYTVTSDEVENGRPSPDMIYYLMRYFGIDNPFNVGKVGDSISDIQQGINAECGLVAAIANQRTNDLSYKYPNVKYLDNLLELIDVLDSFEKEDVKG